jgi:hypothetical protein
MVEGFIHGVQDAFFWGIWMILSLGLRGFVVYGGHITECLEAIFSHHLNAIVIRFILIHRWKIWMSCLPCYKFLWLRELSTGGAK